MSQHEAQRVAIVTMLKNPGPLLRSFLTYHLAVGFDHVFLFFDDPNDPAILEAQQYKDVTVIRNDEALKRELRKTKMYQNGEIRAFADSQVSARQPLIVEVAVGLALRERFDWLLHIDCDELFYSPTQTVKEHFQALADHRIARILYVNHEVVPESADVWDPFREATLFKKHPYTLAERRITEEQRRLIDLCPQLPERFYYFYRSGKSAVRLREGVLPCGPHAFTVPEDRGWQARLNLKVFKSKPAMLAAKVAPGLVKGLADGLYPCRTGLSLDPVILHYPCCGFENFWNKYVNYGRFADTWMGKIDIAATMGSFTIESRDLVARGDRRLAKDFYTRRVVMSDPGQVAKLIDAGLLCRIEGPAILLEELATRRMAA
jgi:glycosyl transferase family 2